MDFKKPSRLSLFMFEFFGYVVLNSYYKKYTKRLELKANEKVLELGSGPGAMSKHLAGVLTDGAGMECFKRHPRLTN